MAVHTLEHGSVIMYYRPTGDTGGLPQPVVDRLGPVAQNNKASYLIPYPSLPDGTALAFTAWNKLLTCPAKITADQARDGRAGIHRLVRVHEQRARGQARRRLLSHQPPTT